LTPGYLTIAITRLLLGRRGHRPDRAQRPAGQDPAHGHGPRVMKPSAIAEAMSRSRENADCVVLACADS
jgi:hypothetical protein